MKGILLSGGTGSRLFPSTIAISKQLLPIYDKPMIYYSLSVLLMAGIKEILIITTEKDLNSYKALLKDGSDFGINLNYEVQDKPNGLAESFLIGEKFIDNDNVCLVLGDNIFYGLGFTEKIKTAKKNLNGACVFGYHVKNPKDFGVLEFDKNNNVIGIEEKPKIPKSNYAITGLYFYDNKVVEYAKTLTPSHRNELEITDLNKIYLSENKLKVELLGRGFAWLDTGTHENLLNASQFIETVEKRQGLKIGCLEEISFNNGWISKDRLAVQIERLGNSSYKDYLKSIII